jgi:hypothetical protein
MGVERVDYYTEDEYQQALQEEAREQCRPQEPNVVPCFKCGGQMYEESDIPEQNICNLCKGK